MMKMIERLLGKQFMTRRTFLSLHGRKSVKKARSFAKVDNFYFNNFIELLEKNRHKRPTLEEVLDHKWFSDFKDI